MARLSLAGEKGRRGMSPAERVLRPGGDEGPEQEDFLKRVILPTLERLSDPNSALVRNFNQDAIRFRLMRAGFPRGLRARDFVLLKWIGVALGLFVFSTCLPLFGSIFGWDVNPLSNPTLVLCFMVFGAYAGFRVPDIWLSMITRTRQSEIQIALPDMIDLISVSVEAGLGLASAIQRVSTRFNNPLSDEFLRTLQEVRLGRTFTEAMRDMGRRTDVPDLSLLISSLVQAELLGLAISNVLKVQSERLREKRSQRAREQAQKAPIKMIFPLVLFIFPSMFVVILGPALISFIQHGQL